MRPTDGPTLLTFAVWDTDQAAIEARRVEPFQLQQALVFAFGGRERAAALLIPLADFSATMVQDLRSSRSKLVQHSAAAQATLAAARDKAVEIKRLRMAADGKAVSLKAGKFTYADAGGCNRGTSHLYSCNQVITGGGYTDPWCLFGCEGSCAKLGGAWCYLSCYPGCWVAPYSYCASYSCTMCAW